MFIKSIVFSLAVVLLPLAEVKTKDIKLTKEKKSSVSQNEKSFICENEKKEVVDCYKWLNKDNLQNAKNHLGYFLYNPNYTDEDNYCIAKLSAKESHQGTGFVLELLRTKLNETQKCKIQVKGYNKNGSHDGGPFQINSIHKDFWKNPKSKEIDYHLEIGTTWFIQWNCIKKSKKCKFYGIFKDKDLTKNLQKIFIKIN